jgi:hypothetical protein
MKKALVAGALGVTGRTLINYLASLGHWEVIGLSRRSPEFRTTAKFIAVDLLNRSEVEARLSGIDEITHVFFAALQPGADFFAEVAPNLAMLTNTVETVARFSGTLRKVVLIEGGQILRCAPRPVQNASKRDRFPPCAAEFLLQSRGLSQGTVDGNFVVLDGVEAVLHLRFCCWESHEHGHGHCRLRRSLQGNEIATALPRVNRRVSRVDRDDGCRASGQSHRLGGRK